MNTYDLRLAIRDAHNFGAHDITETIAQADADYGDTMTWAEIADAIPSWDAIAARLRCPDLTDAMRDALDDTVAFGLPLASTLTSHAIPEDVGRRYLMEHTQTVIDGLTDDLAPRRDLERQAEALRALGIEAEVIVDDLDLEYLVIPIRPDAYRRDTITIRPVACESEDPYVPSEIAWKLEDGTPLGAWIEEHDIVGAIERTLIVLWTTNEW